MKVPTVNAIYHQSRWKGLVSVLAFALTEGFGLAQTFDAAMEFPPTESVKRSWKFGWSENPSAEIKPFGYKQFSVDVGGGTLSAFGEQFRYPSAGIYLPHIAFNPTPGVIHFSGTSQIDYFPGELMMHPGIGTQQAVLQWTAPISGFFGIELRLAGADSFGPTVTVTVLTNSSIAATGTISGFDDRFDWLQTVTLSAGDTVRMNVGNTLGDYPYFDSTRVVAARIHVVSPHLESVPLANPDFEASLEAVPGHVDEKGGLLIGHYSSANATQAGNGFLTTNSIPGWIVSKDGSAGVWNVSVDQFRMLGPAGRSVAWLGSTGGITKIHQTLPARSIESGKTYSLEAMVGAPLGADFSGFHLRLKNGIQVLADLSLSSSPNQAPGLFRFRRLDFQAPEALSGTEWELSISADAGSVGQLTFDGVQLTAAPAQIPHLEFEPDSTVFTGAVQIQILGSPSNSVVYYTMDGSTPDPSSSQIYRGAIPLSESINLQSRAFIGAFPVTPVHRAQYLRAIALGAIIPDAWRLTFFGPGFPYDPRAADQADPDGDSATNLREYLLGTDPMNKRSGFQASVTQVPLIQWPARIGTRYQIEHQDSVGGPWSPWQLVQADQDPMSIGVESSRSSGGYFRVRPVH